MPFIYECMEGYDGPIIAVCDYVKLVAEQVAPLSAGDILQRWERMDLGEVIPEKN